MAHDIYEYKELRNDQLVELKREIITLKYIEN